MPVARICEKVGLEVRSTPVSDGSGIHTMMDNVEPTILGQRAGCSMGDPAGKESCSENVGDCSSEEKFCSLALFIPNCSVDIPEGGTAGEN